MLDEDAIFGGGKVLPECSFDYYYGSSIIPMILSGACPSTSIEQVLSTPAAATPVAPVAAQVPPENASVAASLATPPTASTVPANPSSSPTASMAMPPGMTVPVVAPGPTQAVGSLSASPAALPVACAPEYFLPQESPYPTGTVDDDWCYTFKGKHVTFVQEAQNAKPFVLLGAAMLAPRATPTPTPVMVVWAADQLPDLRDLEYVDGIDSAALFFSSSHPSCELSADMHSFR